MTDTDKLRPEVRDTLDWIEAEYPEASTIRTELLRLADENKRMRGVIETLDIEGHRRAEKVEAELAALKARIAEAPVVACPKTLVHAGNTMQTEFLEYTHERMPGGCNSWAGKRVRLVVEE